MTLTLRLKVHPQSYPWLNKAATEVNQIWNYANRRAPPSPACRVSEAGISAKVVQA